MKPPPPAAPPRRRWLVWLAFAGLWTTALLMPLPERALAVAPPNFKFILAKTVHVLAYAAFTALAGWLGVRARLRWLVLFVVMAHAPATELLQQLLPTHRTGTVRDVCFDHLGVALGLLASWKWWSAPDPVPEHSPGEHAPAAGEAWRG